MPVKVTVKGDDSFRAKLSKLEKKFLTRTVMGQMGGHAITLIVTRVQEEGEDREGKDFIKYSSAYLLDKKARGGRFFSSKPNLTDTGKMLSNLDFTVTSKLSVFLSFPKSDENLKASGHVHGSRSLPKRDFFGLTKDEEASVLEIPKKFLKQEFNNA